MKRIIAVFIFLLINLCFTVQQPDLPKDGFSEGWKKKGSLRLFEREGLYNHINGGSEIFLDFGFEVLQFQKYYNGDDELSIETYKMESAEAALGIYLMKCGKETPISGITTRNTGDRYQIMLIKGEYYILVNNYNGNKSLLPVMVTLANITLKNIPDKEPPDAFSILPKENLIDGTQRLIRGPFTLQSIYTFGQGDMLLLNRKIFGVVGDYKSENNKTYTRIIVKYPNIEYAQKAYSHLLSNLDPYSKIQSEDNDRFSFKDYQGKIGIVTLNKTVLDIKVNLPGNNL